MSNLFRLVSRGSPNHRGLGQLCRPHSQRLTRIISVTLCDDSSPHPLPKVSLSSRPSAGDTLSLVNDNSIHSSFNLFKRATCQYEASLICQHARSFSTCVTLGQFPRPKSKSKTPYKRNRKGGNKFQGQPKNADFPQQVFKKNVKRSLAASLMLEGDTQSEYKQDNVLTLQEKMEEIEALIEAADDDGDDDDSAMTDSESDLSDENDEDEESVADQEEGSDIDNFEEIQLDLGFGQGEDEQDTTKPRVQGGTPNANIPISETPCSGCGAFLHCQDPGIPGYMPSEKYLATPERKLRDQVCQRCYLMRRHNVALKASVSPEEYTDIIKQIKDVRALVVVVIDIMDMPNSIFPNLTELIGKKRPLYIVGNKADLLPPDSQGYLRRLKNMMAQQCEEAGLTTDSYVKHIGLISAKTGYGIEELATRLLNDWGRKGHVYILGCTNVGKSSLFNALLSSDLCKESASDFIHRATTSLWPGTTLNLLKFPIINPKPWKLARRLKRLKLEKSDHQEELRFRKRAYKEQAGKFPTLMGHIGKTFDGFKNMAVGEEDSKGFSGASFDFNTDTGKVEAAKPVDKDAMQGYTYDESEYANSRWCYDTPGVVNPAQIINQLTQHELSVLLTQKTITPRSFILKPGQAMHVSGLARIDLLQAARSVLFTVIAARGIPVNVRDIKDMDAFYNRHVGTKTMGIPLGDAERLARLPPLVSKEMTVVGHTFTQSAADIVFSSIGWVAVTPGPDVEAVMRAYTPGGLGCSLRTPALLPYAINLRGKRSRSASYKVKPLKIFDSDQ